MSVVFNGDSIMDKTNQTNERLTESYSKADEFFPSDNVKLVGDCLRFYAETQGKKDAVVFASSDGVGPRQVVTYKELYEKSLATGISLSALGVKQGEVVALNVRPCPEWLFLTFGSILAGASVASISFTYTDGSDLIAMMERLQKCALLALDPGVDGNNWDIVQKMVECFNQEDGTASSKKMPYLRYLIGHEFPNNVNIKSVQDLLFNEDRYGIELPKGSDDDIAVLFQTSGSTGVPKLVAHTHTTIMYPRKLPDGILFRKNHIYFSDRPFNWVGGFPFSVFVGQTRVTISGFGHPPSNHLHRALDVIVEERCTMTLAIPPMLNAIINIQDRLPSNWPLEVIMTGGQPITKHLCKSIGKVCKALASAYGITEFILLSEKEVNDRNNFIEFDCGRLIRGSGLEMKIVDKDGQIVTVNTRGDILVKGPSMFKEYLNDPVKTLAAVDEQGWFKTDDIGRMTEGGDIFVDGRKSNIIISGGMNVTPEIIEHVIKACPGIAAAIVVPVPDDVYYQVLCACVITKKEIVVTEKDLRKYCEEFHNDKPGMFAALPKFYLFVDSFPETATGKTSRKDLEKMAKQRFAPVDN